MLFGTIGGMRTRRKGKNVKKGTCRMTKEITGSSKGR
jgi:hypothetical protein